MDPRPRPARSTFVHGAVRVARAAGVAIGVAVIFVLSAVGGVILHLNVRAARALAAREVNAVLEPSFKGKIVCERIRALGLTGIAGTDVTIEDPRGVPVLVVRGVRVNLMTWKLVRSLLWDTKAPLSVQLASLSVDRVEADLDSDPDGNLFIADAFAPRTPPPPPDPHARGLLLHVDRVTLHHAWAHGTMAGAPPIDADADDLEASLTSAPDRLEGDIRRMALLVRHIASGADLQGGLAGHVLAPSDPKVRMAGWVHWKGVFGRSAHSLDAALDAQRIDATVDAPAIDAADVRTLLPGSMPEGGGSLHAEVHGVLARVGVVLRASLAGGALNAHGTASVGDDKSADIDFELADVDGHRFVPSAPTTRLGATGHVTAVARADGGLGGTLKVHVDEGRVAENDTPPMSLEGTGSRASNGDVHARASLAIEEPSAPTAVTVVVEPAGEKALRIDFTMRSDVDDLANVPELHHRGSGRIHLAGHGSLDLARMQVDGSMRARAQQLAFGSTRADVLSLEADAHGAATDPHVALRLSSRGIAAAGKRFTRVDVSVSGRASAASVDAEIRSPDLPDMDVSTQLSLRPVLAIDHLRANLTRSGESALLTARRVTVSGGTRIDGLRIEGIGQPLTASLAMSGSAVRLEASTNGIDLGRVGRLAALEGKIKAGTLALDADINVARATARGHARIDLSGAILGPTSTVTAHVDVRLEGRKITGKVHAEGGDVGSVDVDANDLEVAGNGPLLGASWRQMWGSVLVDGHTDVARLAALVPPDELPFDEAEGAITFKMQVQRDNLSDITPAVALHVSTDHLIFSPKTERHRDIDGVLVIAPPPWRLVGIDFDADTHVDGGSGRIDLTTRLRDKKGALMQATLRIDRFPYGDLYGGSPRLRTALLGMPVDLDVRIPTRGLGELPDLLKQNYVGGKVEGAITFKGSAITPVLDMDLALKGSHFSHSSNSEVLDLAATGHYDGVRGTLSLKGKHNDRDAIDMHADLQARSAPLLEGKGGPSMPWTGSARAHFSGFPLEAIPVMDEKLVSGSLNGDLTVSDLHKDGRAKAALSIDQLKVGSYTYKSATVDGEAGATGLSGRLRIDQDDGYVQTDLKAVSTWGAAIAPVLDPNAPLDLTLASKNFRIGVLLPFVEGTVDELDGRLDGTTRIELQPKSQRASVSGQLSLSRGVVEASAGGGELHDVTAEVRFAPDGTVTLQKLTASGLTGNLSATGSVRLDGTSLQSARVTIVIPSRSAIPVSAGGAQVGNVDGRIELVGAALTQGKGIDFKINVPHVRVALPDASSNDAVALGTIEGVRVGAHRGRTDSFVLIPLDPTVPKETAGSASTTTRVEVSLKDVQVTKGADIDVGLRGSINIVSGDKSTVSGQILLKNGGHIAVQGKTFVVESGTVTFVGDDSSNPQIVLKAGWTAKDGTVVYANFVGPLKTGKVTLSSEPALPKEEIVQLLMFGTPDGAQAQNPSASPTDSAIGTAGGEAAQPLNHMLNQWGLGAVSVNVDTSESSSPKPEVEVQIARDLSLQIAVVLGQPPPGVNPDHTLLTVDWRFVSRWSLATTLGDAGTTVFDLLWRKRY